MYLPRKCESHWQFVRWPTIRPSSSGSLPIFRSGLVGNLFDAGVDVEVAKVILRHSDSPATRRHYLHLKSQKQGKAAMKKLERTLALRDKHGTAKTKKK